jgi:hypothetical protein
VIVIALGRLLGTAKGEPGIKVNEPSALME